MSYLINSRKVTTSIFEDIETNKTAVNGILYYSKDDNLAGIGLQDGSIQRIPDGRCRGGVYVDLTDINANITDPAINDWAVVTDATGTIGTIDPNSKSHIVKWNGAEWEIIYTDINDSAWVDTTDGILGTTVITDQTSNAGRSGDTQVSEGGRYVYVSAGIGPSDRKSNLDAIKAESFSNRIESIGMGISNVKIDSYNSGGGECLRTYNATQGNTPKTLKNGSAMREAWSFTGAHSNPNMPIYTLSLDRNNRSVGDVVTWETVLQVFSEGRLRVPALGNGAFPPEIYNFAYMLGVNGGGDFINIPKNTVRKFQNTNAANIPSNNFSLIKSFSFTASRTCCLSVEPTARVTVSGGNSTFKGVLRVNGVDVGESIVPSTVADQGDGVGRTFGSTDTIIANVNEGDSIQLRAEALTTGSNGSMRVVAFVVEEKPSTQII